MSSNTVDSFFNFFGRWDPQAPDFFAEKRRRDQKRQSDKEKRHALKKKMKAPKAENMKLKQTAAKSSGAKVDEPKKT
ncbi:Uu.00g029130.m01.CDS01 [Anthostomella pinea]|uniref:Uu.00g029130.m01.CDS01 n=1 Tax=Anthostomella pinea TaxID=933095 RepID=A0AAI8V829_9PEZI|nr:Uu.00g029130.m01.CDS01 [Anthostomella pinea]